MEFLTYFLAGAMGICLNILFKIQDLKKQSKIANHKFSLSDYFSDDWTTITISFVVVGIAIFTIKELLVAKPELEKHVKWFFIFVGYSGSSLIQAVLSAYTKKVAAIIDIKTNIADGITPAVDATNEEGKKEILKDREAVANNKTVSDEPAN